MMPTESLLGIALLAIPLLAAGLIGSVRSRALMETLHAFAAIGALGVGIAIALSVWTGAPLVALGEFLRVDALSALMVLVITLLGAIAALYALGFMRAEFAPLQLPPSTTGGGDARVCFSPCFICSISRCSSRWRRTISA